MNVLIRGEKVAIPEGWIVVAYGEIAAGDRAYLPEAGIWFGLDDRLDGPAVRHYCVIRKDSDDD